MSNYADTYERDLRSVMAEVGASFESEASQEVEMFLDANEFGLALQTICAVLKQKQIPVSAAAYVKLSDAGKDMEIDPEYWFDLELR